MPFTITQSCVGCQACKKICPVNAISGEKKEIHVIDPVVCIECGACGRICPHTSVLDQLGNLCAMVKRSQWKKPRVNSDECMSCNMCIETCPVNCLALSGAHDSGYPHGYPYLKEEKACIGCGFCSLECPVEAITMYSSVT
ncbi:MAG TPA: 4Fe-4S binding protein [Deltaproteobacteria bacterium]|nr:4Fe-4S binding protein [Deltaproteobacteria bacterium]HPR54981.1 4Fe-4S binding protein [Deltaproteobacteria bacterium]HXK46319.1 4Fe-4S binding protein [Deltaproteobacteria bacterium]